MRLLERLRAQPEVEIHLILTRSGEKTLHIEMGQTAADARKLAHFSYSVEDIGSRLASGSYRTDAMVIAPCSIHTMSAIAAGISDNLLVRAADIALKERRRLIPLGGGKPIYLGKLRKKKAPAGEGGIIPPPNPRVFKR